MNEEFQAQEFSVLRGDIPTKRPVWSRPGLGFVPLASAEREAAQLQDIQPAANWHLQPSFITRPPASLDYFVRSVGQNAVNSGAAPWTNTVSFSWQAGRLGYVGYITRIGYLMTPQALAFGTFNSGWVSTTVELVRNGIAVPYLDGANFGAGGDVLDDLFIPFDEYDAFTVTITTTLNAQVTSVLQGWFDIHGFMIPREPRVQYDYQQVTFP